MSCVNATLCVLIDLSGHELVWRSAGALFSKVVDTVGGALTSISCTTSGVCVAGDATGYAITMTYTARHAKFTWTAPTHVSSSAITAVSCASTFFCGATTEAGGYLQWVRGTWSSVTPVDANPLVTLGCSAQGNCVAIDDQDQQVTATFR